MEQPSMQYAVAAGYVVVLLIALVAGVRWIVKNDPVLRDD